MYILLELGGEPILVMELTCHLMTIRKILSVEVHE